MGLYGSRLEARSLEELAEVLKRLREAHEESRRATDGQHGLEREEGAGDRDMPGEGGDEEDEDVDVDEDEDVDVDEEVDVDVDVEGGDEDEGMSVDDRDDPRS